MGISDRVRGHALAFVVLLLPLAAFFTATGVLRSGFQLQDDHGLILLEGQFAAGTPPATVLAGFLASDLRIRLRPVYVAHRVLEGYLFGTRYAALSRYRFVLLLVTVGLLYGFACQWGLGLPERLLFAGLSVGGLQLDAWWERGPAEGVAMPLFALALLLAVLSVRPGRGGPWLTGGFVAAALGAGLAKESFLVCLPALALLRVWAWRRERGGTWAGAARAGAVPVAALALGLAGALGFILQHLGVGYARMQGLHPLRFVLATGQLGVYVHGLAVTGVAALALAVERGRGGAWGREALVRHGPVLAVAAAILVPNVILYRELGFAPRYLVPGSVAIALAGASLVQALRGSRWRAVAIGVLSLSLAGSVAYAGVCADRWVRDGAAVDAWLAGIKAHTAPGDTVLLVADPGAHYEAIYAVDRYLAAAGRPGSLLLPVRAGARRSYQASLATGLVASADWRGRTVTVAAVADAAAVAVFPGAEAALLEAVGGALPPGTFERDVAGPYVAYGRVAGG